MMLVKGKSLYALAFISLALVSQLMAKSNKCSNKNTCKCAITGDPHYYSFDCKRFDFMGGCSYTLAKTDSKFDDKDCAVHIKSENEKIKKVSFLKKLSVTIGGTCYSLGRGHTAMIDNYRIQTPFISSDVTLFRNGQKLLFVHAKCGVTVSYDGTSNGYVTLNKKRYAGKVTGLCGDCNGKKSDDFRTSSGEVVGKSRLLEFANSFLTGKNANDKSCVEKEKFKSTCKEEFYKDAKRSAKLCGLIDAEKGPFAKCLASGKVSLKNIQQNCLIDVCEHRHSYSNQHKVRCQVLADLATQCAFAGYEKINWRRAAECDYRCEHRHEEYKHSAASCPKTCNPHLYSSNSMKKLCSSLPRQESCECKPGYVRHDTGCVWADSCKHVIHAYRLEMRLQVLKFKLSVAHAICPKLEVEIEPPSIDPKVPPKPVPEPIKPDDPTPAPIVGPVINPVPPPDVATPPPTPPDPVEYSKCKCVVRGDPHYHTYDGSQINFMGTCTYTLSRLLVDKDESKRSDYEKNCDFHIAGKNKKNKPSSKVSYLEAIEITSSANAKMIRLLRKGIVEIGDDKDAVLPQTIAGVEISKLGANVFVKSEKCGWNLKWNSLSSVTIEVTSNKAKRNMDGMCGDCDGDKKNDIRTRNGTVYKVNSLATARFIGDSYLVGEHATCEKTTPPFKSKCKKEFKKTLDKYEHCGILTSKSSPFHKCVNSGKLRHKDILHDCHFDLCELNGEKEFASVRCELLEEINHRCSEIGFSNICWRHKFQCPIDCEKSHHGGKHTIHKSQLSLCPRTCKDPLGINCANTKSDAKIHMPEGCECKPNYVLDQGKCISPSKCPRK